MKKIGKDEIERFITEIGRVELFADMKNNGGYPRIYFKAVCASLIALGYDSSWVTHQFLDALEGAYMEK